MKYVSIDLETTGLNPDNIYDDVGNILSPGCQILEFGAVLEDTNNIIPIDQLPFYHAYITQPNDIISGSVFAIHMNVGIIEKIKNKKILEDKFNFVGIDDLAQSFLFWLSKHGFEIKTSSNGGYKYSETITVAGKNFSGFDKMFLNKVPNFNKFIKIRHRVIDPSIFFIDWKKDNAPPSLDDCKIRAGIDGVVSHLAVDDAKDVIKLLRKSYA